jgi:ankyrin repeat protein
MTIRGCLTFIFVLVLMLPWSARGDGPEPTPVTPGRTDTRKKGTPSQKSPRDELSLREIAVDGDSLIHFIRKGHLEVVNLLLAAGVDPNARDGDGRPALLISARAQPAIVTALLGRGADINSDDLNERTALMEASEHGNVEAMRILLGKGANPRYKDIQDVTPLFLAASKGHEDAVNLLLAHGAEPNVANKEGKTAIVEAALGNHAAIVAALRGKGAHLQYQDRGGLTLPVLVVERAGEESLRAMSELMMNEAQQEDEGGTLESDMEAIRQVERLRERWLETVLALLKDTVAARVADQDGVTVLHHAARTGPRALVEALLRHGADPNARGANGKTPLTEAVGILDPSQRDPIASDPGAALPVSKDEGEGLLKTHRMKKLMWDGEGGVIASLLAGGADAGLKDSSGKTALAHAITTHSIQAIAALLSHAEKVRTLPEELTFYFSSTVRSCNAATVRVMLNGGAKVNDKDVLGMTPLMWAGRRCDVDMAEMLLNAGAKVNDNDATGMTPLMWAVHARKTEVVSRLLGAGARIDYTDESGLMALDWAKKYGGPRIVELLENGRLKNE